MAAWQKRPAIRCVIRTWICFLKIAASEQTVIRFEGDHKLYDLTVSAEDKQAIVDIINLYYAMQQ